MDLQTATPRRSTSSMRSPVEKQLKPKRKLSTTESYVETFYDNFGFEGEQQISKSQPPSPISPRSLKGFTLPLDKQRSNMRGILNSDSLRLVKNGKANSIQNRCSTLRFDSSSLGSVADLETASNDSIDKREFMKETVFKMTSIMYAIFIVILSCTFSATDLRDITIGQRQIYNVILAIIGVLWLSWLHYDLQRYKSSLMKKMFPNGNISAISPLDSDGVERLSTATEVIFNNTTNIHKRSASVTSINIIEESNQVPGYRFIRGRESGSFYLKIGMAAFCFGHIIHEGLMFSQQIYYLSSNEKHCLDVAKFALHIIRPLYSFYQLFMLFKYSNLVINRNLPLAQFGLMHLIGTSATFWLGAILDDAIEYLESKYTRNATIPLNVTDDSTEILPEDVETRLGCSLIALPSNKYDSALPYLYPFAIEFNLILAALWFVVWQNIGKDSHTTHPHHFQHKVCQDLDGNEEVQFESNLVLRADCHASNKGLFGGMFILLVSLITMILFFVSVNTQGYVPIGVYIFTSQELLITGVIAVVSAIAFSQTQKLNINPFKNSSHTLDILLLMIPLPFYFLNNILSIRSDFAMNNWPGVCMHFVVTLQVLIQTVFISTAMHRCSDERQLRFTKPGRELITFLILLNISLWIISTFETKAVEKHQTQPAYYGSIMWMVLSHTTLPLMLFYRFHATVCLADIWKFAYEKAHS